MQLLILIASLLTISFSKFVSQQYRDCGGDYNDNPLLKLEAKLISETAHGQKYLMQQGDNLVYLLNVTGTPYEMGFAYGKLMATEVEENLGGFINYALDGLDVLMTEYSIPLFIRKIIEDNVVDLAWYLLDLNWQVAEPYIPSRYPEELQGIADASGLNYTDIRNINMVPEIIKAACTIAGTWSNATVDHKLLTLRGLDWSADAPINKYPLITIYHSTEPGSHPFSNVGYTGLIGALTAVGSQGVSVSEKVWIPNGNDGRKIPDTYVGKPWIFVTRDLAQFGTTLQNMADTLYNTNRTCKIHMGIGSAQSNGYEGVDYSWKVLEFFNDQNYTSYGPWHPQLDGVVYFDKHTQPSNNYCVGDIFTEQWGKITWETLFRQVGGLSSTGDTQLMVADLFENVIYLSYSAYKTNIVAYRRSPMYIDLKPFYGITGSLKKD